MFSVNLVYSIRIEMFLIALSVPAKVFIFAVIMKKLLPILFLIFYFSFFIAENTNAQCSICSKTAQQLGDKPAKGFNSGIIYLMLTPFAIAGFVGYKWWQNNKDV